MLAQLLRLKFPLIALCLIFAPHSGSAQQLYIKTFGKPGAKPLVFLHGGPGYNSANFEGTTAATLADKGFFVVVYDRRGEGRSTDPAAAFTFSQTFADLDSICGALQLRRPTLIGHSFGGVIGTLYAEKFPSKVGSLILVAAPVSLQETFRTILHSSEALYRQRNDSANLKYIDMLRKMDTSLLQYSSFTFRHAMQNGFYSPKNRSEEAKKLFAKLMADSLLKKQAASMSFPAPVGFHKNEHYTSIHLKGSLQKLVASGLPVYGLYGREDGLYSAQQVDELREIVGRDRLLYLDDCSHNVFIDQQATLLQH